MIDNRSFAGHFTASILFAALSIAWGTNVLQAEDGIEKELVSLGGALSKALQGSGHSSATLEVSGNKTLPSSGPAMIKEVLGSELIKGGITIKEFSAEVGIAATMKHTLVPDDMGNPTAVMVSIDVKVVDRNDDPINSISTDTIKITNASEVAKLLGFPADLPPGESINEQLVSAATGKAQQATSGSEIKAKRESPFSIEVIVDGKPKPAQVKEGFAIIGLDQADRCQIRLVNGSNFEAAVQLTLDGIDCFFFTERKAGLWLVPPRGSLVVKGWQLDKETAREFRIVPFEQSVAASAGSTGNVGVICAFFHRAYKPGEPLAEDERGPSTKSLGVGAGDQFANKVEFVDRTIGKLRASIPVRYKKPEQQKD